MKSILVLIIAASFTFGCALNHSETQPGDAGWTIVSPDEVDIDAAALDALTSDIRAGEYLNIHSLLIVRKGKLAYEAYFAGDDERRGEPIGRIDFDQNTLHDARSVTKSVVSALFGLALAEGAIEGVETPVLEFFPEHADLRSPARDAILLKHALSMTTGFEWDEGSVPYGHPDNDETAMDSAADHYRYVLEKPVAYDPGVQWEYSGGDTMLLAAAIERATNEDLVDFANRMLFKPLGIEQFEWLRYEDNVPITASGLRLRPRDMARIGQLYLDGGQWRGKQIIPKAWIDQTLAPQAHIADRPTGFQQYGYQWWLGTARVGDDFIPFAAAVGWGGQRILLVPSLDTVIVVTAGLYGHPAQTGITFEIMLDRVLPAIR